MDKLKKINELEVVDWDCESGEVIYVHVEDTEKNRKLLSSLGATEDDFKNMEEGLKEDGLLDISWFAFFKLNADWFMPEVGFGKEHENNFIKAGNTK